MRYSNTNPGSDVVLAATLDDFLVIDRCALA